MSGVAHLLYSFYRKMSKKIYDIRPPQLPVRIIKREEIAAIDEKKTEKNAVKSSSEFKKRKSLKEIFIGGGIIFILLTIYLYNRLPKSDIFIWPKLHQLSAETKILADKLTGDIDSLNGVIPARYVEEELSGQQEVQSTGSLLDEAKASGTIRIYNNIEPLMPFTLIKGTHFLSDSGKSFKTLEKVTIPAASYQKGKLAPGSVNAKVEAVEPGEEYNIGPSKFSAPKLSGSAYFYGIHAESSGYMTGGYAGQKKKVTKEDVEKAKTALTNELLARAEDILRSKLSSDDILPDNVVLKDIVEFNSSLNADTVADKFSVSAKVKVSALVFNKKNVENFAKAYFSSRLSDGKSLLEESVNINYAAEKIDIKGGKMSLNLKMSASEYQSIDKIYLIDLFAGKSSGEMREIAESVYGEEIAKIEADFWPFWVRNAPKDRDRIKTNLKFE